MDADLLILLAVLLPPAALDGLGRLVEERTVPTPYGAVGPLARRQPQTGPSVWLQPYTGVSTRTDPRSTIYAALSLGVGQILNWDQGIAINPVLQRGHVAVVSDYVDFTRQPTSFGGGMPGSFGRMLPASVPWEEGIHRPPLCPRLSAALHRTIPFAVNAVYLGVDGPRRETPAEARIYRQWGIDVIGQNLIPEAALAQEVGLCYAGLVTVGDLGADRPLPAQHGEVRAALGAVLTALPALAAEAMTPGVCGCADQRVLL